MSSESTGSDTEEFYDAQDTTPGRPSRLRSLSSIPSDNGEEADSSVNLEEEEQKLLNQKKLIEARRKTEEDEIRRKLASLERRKQKKRDKELQKSLDRTNLSSETVQEQPQKSEEQYAEPLPRPIVPECASSEQLGACYLGPQDDSNSEEKTRRAPDDILEEKLEALSFELEMSGHFRSDRQTLEGNVACDTAAGLSGHPDSAHSRDASQLMVGRTIGSFDSDSFEDAPDTLLSGIDSTHYTPNKSFSYESKLNAPGSISKSGDKLNDDKSNTKTSSLPIQLCVFPTETPEIQRQPIVYQEPDIIQSTKSLPRQQPLLTSTPKVEGDNLFKKPQVPSEGLITPVMRITLQAEGSSAGLGPVAPPRKRKQDRSRESIDLAGIGAERSSDRDSLSHVSSQSSLTVDPESLPLSPFPTGYRPSLDLSSATKGNRHVMATDDESAKGNSLDNKAGPPLVMVNEEERVEQGKNRDDGDSDDSLDRLVLREDSVDESMKKDYRDIHPSPMKLNILRQKSKTLGGSTEELRKQRTASGKILSDQEILAQQLMTNLDTGEKFPMSAAEDKIPPSINPLSLQIMKITKEFPGDGGLQKAEKGLADQGKTVNTVKVPKKRGKKIKKFLSKSVRKIKSELKSGKEDKNSSSDEDELVDGRRMIKIKAANSNKGPYDFDLLVPVQNLAEDSGGAVWTMKFSHCGKLLATGGQDNLLRVWVLKTAYAYFDDMRQKYSEAARVSPTPSQTSLSETGDKSEDEEYTHAPFVKKPFFIYKGHTADLLDVSWSKNYFILSSSMDKTVRLWHVSRKECLCCFQHIDFVTAIAFHPKDDRYFLSGSLDGKLRLWSIPEKRVALWNEVSGQSKLITAANFCTDGKIAVGTYDGRCILYTADHLDYHTQIHVRSTRGKNAKGGKITGVEPLPGDNKILVTSNDSRIRLYDLRDKTLTCKYKGSANNSSRIKASFNHDGRYIICGSEDGCVYIWKTQHDLYQFYSVRRDRNDYWESVKAHVAVVTAAIFAPDPSLIIRPQFAFMDSDDKETSAGVRGEVLISADFNGGIKIFINKFKPGSG